MALIKLNHIHDFSEYSKKTTVHQFLHALPGPSVFHFSGDNSETRVITTLLHGNEPSGLRAIHRLLREGFQPVYQTKLIVASVTAAKTEPEFTHRMLPGKADLNRCFDDSCSGLQGKLAQSIREHIQQWQPSLVVDIHNTSGSGPAFSVATCEDEKNSMLASYFCQRQIVTDIQLGSLMECEFGCPTITIEAGGAQDNEADITAYNGIKGLLSAKKLSVQRDVEILNRPRRLELHPSLSIGYLSFYDEQFDVCVRPDIEKFNFGITKKGTILAHVSQDGFHKLMLDNGKVTDGFFNWQNNTLSAACDLKLFMVTSNPEIAKSDCLLYFVAV